MGPLQVRHVGSQASHVFEEVLGNFPVGQLVGHEVPSRYLVPVQERQSVDRGPLQVEHSEWQESQVLVEVLG